MNAHHQPPPPYGSRREGGGSGSAVEWLTAGLLLLVIGAAGWMVAMAYQPAWLRLGSAETEVIGIVGLLGAALGMVSWVALRHTR